MNLFGISEIISGVEKVADVLTTTDEERLKLGIEEKKLELEAKKLDVGLASNQIELNKIDAQSKHFFNAGWRPYVGWLCGAILTYNFLLQPMLNYFIALLAAFEVVPTTFSPPPQLEAGAIMTIITGMLGIGGMRSFDKQKGTQTDKIKNK